MNRRGYLWCTADPIRAEDYREHGLKAAAEGAGELRIHTGRMSDPDYRPHMADGWEDQPEGADLILEDMLLQQAFPYLGQDVYAALHTRRCGWLSGQQLGMELLERARAAGVEIVEGRVESVETTGGRVTGVRISGRSGNRTHRHRPLCRCRGTHARATVARLLDVELPVFSELHLKTSFEDHLGRRAAGSALSDLGRSAASRVVGRGAGGAGRERGNRLADEDPARRRPHAARGRSATFCCCGRTTPSAVPETFPLEIPDEYTELCLRGLTTVLPGLAPYLDRLPKPFVDGGYYTKTRENRPLACPLPVEGAFVHGALSGFGLMASSATAEVCAAHITGDTLPDYAPAFDLGRYDDAEYLARLEAWGDDGQL